MAFTLPDLPYAYDALEPTIDAMTMEIHHSKHHNGYTTKLNAALESAVFEDIDYATWSIEDLLTKLNDLPDEIQWAVRNNWGGYYNHKLFWEIMTPWGKPMSETMKNMIVKSFGSVDGFNEMFAAAAGSRFGSGRAWLVKDGDGLSIMSTANQDNPLTDGLTPILGLDVWEHAYYLKYQNKRPDYINAWMSIVNREVVEKNLNA